MHFLKYFLNYNNLNNLFNISLTFLTYLLQDYKKGSQKDQIFGPCTFSPTQTRF